jgi:hypothetical protein
MTLYTFCMFLTAAVAVLTSDSALATGPKGEDCPQGRRIRVQKAYPLSMSDCEVLDADTAAENQKLRRSPAAAVSPAYRAARMPETDASPAVLVEEDPNFPQGRQYVGAVIWRTEPVKAAAGQAADIAVHAEIDIPERKLTMDMSFRRNTDTSLPASHTAELTFIRTPDLGGISTVSGILMKFNEQARGSPLLGLAVKVNSNLFMIGLSGADSDRTRNLALLRERSWFDTPIVYNDGRRAIIAFRKGPSGQRAFDQAFAWWNEDTGGKQTTGASAATSDAGSLAALQTITPQMEKVDRYFWLAFNASICQLRSLAWFGVIRSSWEAWSDQVIKGSGITYEQANKISQSMRSQVEIEYGQFPAICQRLSNSAIMDELDIVETKATGNYH